MVPFKLYALCNRQRSFYVLRIVIMESNSYLYYEFELLVDEVLVFRVVEG